jgi:hypothetical protein
MVQGELSELFDCELQIHRTSAFLVLGENCQLGRCFPEENTLSDIALLCFGILREKIGQGAICVPADERIAISREEWEGMLEECKNRHGNGWIKTYREKTTGEFVREMTGYMEEMEFIRVDENTVWIGKIAGKLAGKYPADFQADG